MINKCIEFIQTHLLPQACMVCKQPSNRSIAICRKCLANLPVNSSCCSRCAIPLVQADQLICATCQAAPPPYHASRIPLLYQDPVSQWIRDFKFHNNLVKGKLLSDLFYHYLEQADFSRIEALIPVPLHPARTRQRGYNQSLLLAKHISKMTGIRVDSKLVKRSLKTRPQHELALPQRFSNLKNAFELTRQCHYRQVAIIDDVVTTGSTVNEIARLLKNQYTEIIHVWAMARTVPK